ncbi:pinin isoform X1 [Colias croceus]|uniref:pinin isoform X1 n=1 Tax=Colias crocea TaxID=72248 RepID=UPI001E2800C6|nr:pinin isoform X1 [Colias croceus]
MGTEVALSFSTLRTQLENERNSLFKLDENIKKIVQTSGRYNNESRYNPFGDHSRGGPRLGGRNSYTEANKNDDQFFKRKHETKTVFSRLSAKTNDSDGEEDVPGPKRTRVSSAVCRELPTRAAVLRAQGDDEQARTRNRRIFGSLLGTLQKFKQEEIVLQTKEDKKAQVERKIEEQARQEKERELKERRVLFAEREHKKATIKALEAKMMRVQEFEKWEESQRSLGNFILTKAKPHIYWLPRRMSEKATEKLTSSRKYHEKCMAKKRQELQEELQRIEQRCLRQKPGAKENDPHDDVPHDQHVHELEENGNKKRDKFAMDADDKEDSDADDQHDDKNMEQELTAVPEPEEIKMDTSTDHTEQNDIVPNEIAPNVTVPNDIVPENAEEIPQTEPKAETVEEKKPDSNNPEHS